MIRCSNRTLIAACLLFLNTSPLGAVTLLINQHNPLILIPPDGYGYGLPRWTSMTAKLDAAFSPSNITVSNQRLDDLNALLAYDRLWITLRDLQPELALTPLEQANVAAFVATGRRAVLVGENLAFFNWNVSILTPQGGSYTEGGFGPSTTIYAHPLTENVHELELAADGASLGGTPLFSSNVAALWGPSENALTVMSANVIGEYHGLANLRFQENIANWLAAPEPGSSVLGVMALASLMRARRRRRGPLEP
jgi:hypothetical protein